MDIISKRAHLRALALALVMLVTTTQLANAQVLRDLDARLIAAVESKSLSQVRALLDSGADPYCNYRYKWLDIDAPRKGSLPVIALALG